MFKRQKGFYREKASLALSDQVFQRGLEGIQKRIGKATLERYLEIPDIQGARKKAKSIRMWAVEHLYELLEVFSHHVKAQGGEVFFAENAQSAREIISKVASMHRVRTIVKGKSMASEEIMLNPSLEAMGIEVFETDLGEYIIQLAGERPSHIIGPAIHKSREQIGRLFSERLGVPYTHVPEELTLIARTKLREKFLKADMGITGCNLALASTGQVMLVSNEGNIRMAITLPKVHLVLMGMEKIVEDLEGAVHILRLLSRAAAAQRMATYVSVVGAKEKLERGGNFYVVILDNGRSKIQRDQTFKEILCCIRCGACLNVCPVYGKIGGYAYGSTYSGPVGAVLNPLLWGIDTYKDLFFGETLCGACKERCPIDIDIPAMLLALRRIYREGDDFWGVRKKLDLEYLGFKAWEVLVKNPKLYRLMGKIPRPRG